ncbi:hypothetical protein ACO2RV_17220 [Ancylobacter sp. VNQ12]|uniref:hypothetical protein n=1 Tax=Ancylobacter sp. VNQ12 TaxID=3400920 RepID=UPI003C10E8D9
MTTNDIALNVDQRNISITEIENEPRARDLDIGKRLGLARPRVIRELIARNRQEIEGFGPLAVRHGESRGQEFTEYWLTEEQALLVATLSSAPNAAAVRAMLIRAFVAWRRGHLGGTASLAPEVLEMIRRDDGISRMLARKVTALEGRIDNLLVSVNARVAALEYVSVRELLEEAKAIQKGRRGLNRKVGHELKNRALLAGYPAPCRRCPHSGVWLFQRDFASLYMKESGAALVADHNARQRGQGNLFVIPAKGGEARV